MPSSGKQRRGGLIGHGVAASMSFAGSDLYDQVLKFMEDQVNINVKVLLRGFLSKIFLALFISWSCLSPPLSNFPGNRWDGRR